ncbi:MAG: lactate utilization protein [Lachnospiraceae bacterium]|nr:lactate utilization protein [Lachnospiraceae bacterium]
MKPKKQYYENISKSIIKGLEKRQMEGYYCPDRESAVKLALELMPEGSSIGWGGSLTLTETGLMDAIRNSDYEIIDRETASTPEEQRKLYGEICCSDFFLMSTNAITVDGELINIDGRGNRVAFLCFGPQNVIVFAGMNKVVTDVEAGLSRARNMAAPPNTVRLNKKTPCSVTGKCGDCFSPDCICSQFVVTRRSGVPNRIKVILVGEELGY